MNSTGQRNQKIESKCEPAVKWPYHALLVAALMLVPIPVCSTDWRPLPDSGQTICYDKNGTELSCPVAGEPLYGQDAQYQGAAPSYQENGNQTVTDHNTGLTWISSGVGIQRTWQDALSYCDELVFAGQSDWRLPGKFELESIVDYGSSYPAINRIMSCQSSFYWSATPHATNLVYAWSVFCMDGADHWVHKSNAYYVRCVRGGI